MKKVFDRQLRDDAVQNERERRGKQQAERAGGRQETDREAFAVAVADELRSPAEQRDRHAIAARLLPLGCHLLQVLVPDGSVGQDGCQLDRDRLCRQDTRRHEQQQHRAHQPLHHG